MKRATYREAVRLVAYNDEDGAEWRLDTEEVAGLVTVLVVAELFGVTQERVAKDVVALRQKDPTLIQGE